MGKGRKKNRENERNVKKMQKNVEKWAKMCSGAEKMVANCNPDIAKRTFKRAQEVGNGKGIIR